MKGKRFEVPAVAVYALSAAMLVICAAVIVVALSGNDTDGKEGHQYNFPVIIREAHDDASANDEDDGDLPTGRGIYE